MNETTPNTNSSNDQIGPIVGSVIVIIVLIIGGLYFYGERLARGPENTEQTTETGNATEQQAAADPAAQRLRTQGTSDDTAAIEADLNATDVDSINSEMNSDSSLSF